MELSKVLAGGRFVCHMYNSCFCFNQKFLISLQGRYSPGLQSYDFPVFLLLFLADQFSPLIIEWCFLRTTIIFVLTDMPACLQICIKQTCTPLMKLKIPRCPDCHNNGVSGTRFFFLFLFVWRHHTWQPNTSIEESLKH